MATGGSPHLPVTLHTGCDRFRAWRVHGAMITPVQGARTVCKPLPVRSIRHRRHLQACRSASTGYPVPESDHAPSTARSFGKTAGLVGCLGLISKVMGVARESIISSAFGLGVTADAFNMACTIPLLFLTSLGGLNGALHTAVVSVSSARCVMLFPPGSLSLAASCDRRRTPGSLLSTETRVGLQVGGRLCTGTAVAACCAQRLVRTVAR